MSSPAPYNSKCIENSNVCDGGHLLDCFSQHFIEFNTLINGSMNKKPGFVSQALETGLYTCEIDILDLQARDSTAHTA